MNFHIVLHLLKTDWHRLRRPIISLWIIILLTALPWVLHDPHGFSAPFWFSSNGNMDIMKYYSDGTYGRFQRELLLNSMMAGSVVAVLLAAAIGMHHKTWQRVSPVREIERLTATALEIFLFMIAPQTICIIANLGIHGFSGQVIARAVAIHGVASFLILGFHAVFGAWCANFWLWFAGISALIGSQALLPMILPQRAFLINWPFEIVLWIPVSGPLYWALLGSAMVLLAVLFPFTVGRMHGATRITVAVAITMGCALATSGMNHAYRPMPKIVGSESPGPRPVLHNAKIETETSGIRFDEIRAGGYEVKADLDTVDCPPGCAVSWIPSGTARILQGETTIANFEPPSDRRSIMRSGGYFMPKTQTAGDMNAIIAALPARSKPLPDSYSNDENENHSVNFGPFFPSPGVREGTGGTARLEMNVTGMLYHYQRIIDVPVGEEACEVKDGNTTYQIRRFPSSRDRVWVELVTKHPALGFASSPEEISWIAPPTDPCRFFLHLPGSGVNLKLRAEFSQAGPLLSGAGWNRKIYQASPGDLRSQNQKEARFIMLKPVLLAEIPANRITATLRREDQPHRQTDFVDTRGYRMEESLYLHNYLPVRPVPETCSRQEFGRWLRIPALIGGIQSVTARDIASYAPRFSDVMAKVAFMEPVAEAIRLATPESSKHLVIKSLGSMPDPGLLADVAVTRGWGNDAAAVLIDRFLQGDIRKGGIDAIISLEDPKTYPALISGLMEAPDLRTYEKLRQLPGIRPALSEAIVKSLSTTDLKRTIAVESGWKQTHPFGPYLLPAKDGNSEAFSAVLAIYQQSGPNGHAYYSLNDLKDLIAAGDFSGSINQGWFDFIRGKTVDDFQYDTLARIWRPQAAR